MPEIAKIPRDLSSLSADDINALAPHLSRVTTARLEFIGENRPYELPVGLSAMRRLRDVTVAGPGGYLSRGPWTLTLQPCAGLSALTSLTLTDVSCVAGLTSPQPLGRRSVSAM